MIDAEVVDVEEGSRAAEPGQPGTPRAAVDPAGGGAAAWDAKWDPLNELTHGSEAMNQLFERAMARTDFDAATEARFGWTPGLRRPRDTLRRSRSLPRACRVWSRIQIDLQIDGDDLIVRGRARDRCREPPGEQFHRVERSHGRSPALSLCPRRFRPLPPTANRSRPPISQRSADGSVLPTRDAGDAVRVDRRLRRRGPPGPRGVRAACYTPAPITEHAWKKKKKSHAPAVPNPSRST